MEVKTKMIKRMFGGVPTRYAVAVDGRVFRGPHILSCRTHGRLGRFSCYVWSMVINLDADKIWLPRGVRLVSVSPTGNITGSSQG